MVNTLVTGCAGYLGSLLCSELLANGYKVIGVDNFFYKNSQTISGFIGHKNFEFYPMDIRDSNLYKLTNKCAIIFHLACLVGAPRCKVDEKLTIEINQTATENLVKNLSGQRLIYPTTNSQYGTSEEICTEESPIKALSLYAQTKTNAEKCVLDYQNSISLRLATVFGSSYRIRMDLLVNSWTAELFFFKKLEIYESHFKRNCVHIRDVIRCFQFMIDPQFSGIYNVGLDSANLTKKGFAEKICQILGLSNSCISEGLGEDSDKRNYIVSNNKLLKTGFQFKYNLEDGIKEISQLCSNIGYPILKNRNI